VWLFAVVDIGEAARRKKKCRVITWPTEQLTLRTSWINWHCWWIYE